MILSGVFWIVLAASVVLFWTMPRRLRMPFLAATSAGYIIWYGYSSWGPEHWVYRWSGVWLLGFCALFYMLAPLARRSARSAPARVAAAAQDAKRQGANAVATAVLEQPALPAHQPHRWVLPVLLFTIIAYLAAFKYAGVFKYICPPLSKYIFPQYSIHRPGGPEAMLLIPLGISYFTFKFIHYAVEVARGTIKDRSPWQFLSYVYFFPAFSAGPIERFDHFLANQDSRLSTGAIAEGLTRIIHGLIKKFFICEIVLAGWYSAAANPSLMQRMWEPTTMKLWGLAIASYLYLYMDFSGYCDIAIGAARLYGIRIMENFDWPIFSPNIGTFWKRWHMTLAGWCQWYIYMPMLARTRNAVVALFTTFIVIGLWHEGSVPWLTWGLYNAAGILIYQLWARYKRKMKWSALDKGLWKYSGIPLTFLFVSAGEVLTFACAKSGHDMLRVVAKLVYIHVRP